MMHHHNACVCVCWHIELSSSVTKVNLSKYWKFQMRNYINIKGKLRLTRLHFSLLLTSLSVCVNILSLKIKRIDVRRRGNTRRDEKRSWVSYLFKRLTSSFRLSSCSCCRSYVCWLGSGLGRIKLRNILAQIFTVPWPGIDRTGSAR